MDNRTNTQGKKKSKCKKKTLFWTVLDIFDIHPIEKENNIYFYDIR